MMDDRQARARKRRGAYIVLVVGHGCGMCDYRGAGGRGYCWKSGELVMG